MDRQQDDRRRIRPARFRRDVQSDRTFILTCIPLLSTILQTQETAKLEHETFVNRQKANYAAEIKATLDSWVRFEAQQREAEQADLVKSIQEKVLSNLQDPKMQKEVLAQAVADIEGGFGSRSFWEELQS